VDKGSRQNGFVTSGKEMALKVECRGVCVRVRVSSCVLAGDGRFSTVPKSVQEGTLCVGVVRKGRSALSPFGVRGSVFSKLSLHV